MRRTPDDPNPLTAGEKMRLAEIEPFLGHRGGCAAYKPVKDKGPCDCGLADLRVALAAPSNPGDPTEAEVERGVDWAMLTSSKRSERAREQYRPYVRGILAAAKSLQPQAQKGSDA